MKNVTITMAEDVARWARIEAAKQEMSLARWVGDVLRAQMEEDAEYELAMRRSLERTPRWLRASDAPPEGEGGTP